MKIAAPLLGLLLVAACNSGEVSGKTRTNCKFVLESVASVRTIVSQPKFPDAASALRDNADTVGRFARDEENNGVADAERQVQAAITTLAGAGSRETKALDARAHDLEKVCKV